MERTWLSFWDFIIPPIHLVIIFIIVYVIKKKNIEKDPDYAYFQKSILLKIIGGISFALIYSFYYFGGDSTNFYEGSICMQKLCFKEPSVYFSILAGNLSNENMSFFDSITGFPLYYEDPPTFTVIRIASFISFFSFRSYFSMTIIFSVLSFIGVWKLFKLFSLFYPHLRKQFAYVILFFPSVLFWGSGVLKDSITLMATCWFTYSFYFVFIYKKDVLKNALWLLIMAVIIITVKPYIFIALMPGALLWLIGERIKGITNWFIKLFFGPVLLIFISLVGIFAMQQMSSSFGQYSSIDNVLYKASETQKDLKQAYYHGNSFDIGDYEPTIQGVLAKMPAATMAGLYRPYLWDVKNIVMFLSAIENTFVLLFSIYVLFKIGLFRFLRHISNTPILFFSLIFAVFFAFSVGISTSNFGALVRYKIPCIPFLMASLFVLYDFEKKQRKDLELKKQVKIRGIKNN
jgi:hypothetical protein